MSADDNTPPPKESGSTMDSAKDFAAGILGSLQTRLELLSNELAEERARLEKIVLYGVLFVGTGIIFVVLFTLSPLFLIRDPLIQDITFGVILLIYLLAAVVSGILLRKQLRDRGKPFEATIEELRKDRERLGHFFNRKSD